MNNRYEMDTLIGRIYYSECGVIPEDEAQYHDDWEEMLEDRQYTHFTRSELFWRIYDWLILPSRQNFYDAYPEGDIGSLRLYRIEELENVLTCVFYIDALDELSVDIKLATCNSLEEALETLLEGIKEAVVDDDEIREFICVDFSSQRDVPFGETDIRQRMLDEVFHPMWIEE